MSDSLDTCVILAYAIGEPIDQRDAAWDLLGSGAEHYVADLALTEAAYVLEDHYRHSRKEVVYLLRKFLGQNDKVLNYNRALFDLVFPFYEAHPALSFNDCCLAAYAELGHAEPLFTFDRKLARQHPSAKMLQV